jgi:predicted PurR-regulated permease PerM
MKSFTKITRTLIFVFFAIAGLYFGRRFLVPITLGCMLAMLLTPISVWLERRNMGRIPATLLPVLLFVMLVATVITLLSWQVAGLVDDANRISSQINRMPGKLQDYIDHTLGISAGTQQQIISSSVGEQITLLVGSVASIIGKSLLVVVYIFLFLYYRNHLRDFVLKLVPQREKQHAEMIINSSGSVSQKYISGIARMVLVLWVMYGVGFSIVGVKHALFFAVLCGILEIIPYVGNITGSLLTAVMAFTQGGPYMALWILAVYGVVQFTQTYLLEPLIVGAKVSINPLFTIIGLIIGDILWGIPGMILAIPLLGIVKILCDNVPGLDAYGFLIGEVKINKKPGKPA